MSRQVLLRRVDLLFPCHPSSFDAVRGIVIDEPVEELPNTRGEALQASLSLRRYTKDLNDSLTRLLTRPSGGSFAWKIFRT